MEEGLGAVSAIGTTDSGGISERYLRTGVAGGYSDVIFFSFAVFISTNEAKSCASDFDQINGLRVV